MKQGPRGAGADGQRVRRMLAARWLLFVLIVALVMLLTLLSWRRSLRPTQAALSLPSTLSSQSCEQQERSALRSFSCGPTPQVVIEGVGFRR
ncbi:MAG: hypothetical protein HYZ72_20715 [Deltaproteobacteria bacterium]|nr:hypothetical protein [Deltaproteobacteria bacterium]